VLTVVLSVVAEALVEVLVSAVNELSETVVLEVAVVVCRVVVLVADAELTLVVLV